MDLDEVAEELYAVPPDEFVAYQAGLPEHPEMAADGGPGDRKERCDLAGTELAAGQGGHNLPARRVGDRREHIHDRKRNSKVTLCRAIRLWSARPTPSFTGGRNGAFDAYEVG